MIRFNIKQTKWDEVIGYVYSDELSDKQQKELGILPVGINPVEYHPIEVPASADILNSLTINQLWLFGEDNSFLILKPEEINIEDINERIALRESL